MVTSAPRSISISRGPNSSDCSKRSVAMISTRARAISMMLLHCIDTEHYASMHALFRRLFRRFTGACPDGGYWRGGRAFARSEEHTSELQSLMRILYAVFCLKTKKPRKQQSTQNRA